MLRPTKALWLLLALSSAALAQTQRPQLTPTQRPFVPNIAPAQPPQLTPPNGTAKTARLQFPNADVKDVLNYYQKLADVRLVYDNQVVGPVNIFIEGDLPVDEAKMIIEINLLMNGFTLVPVEGTKIVKVIGIGKSPRTAGIPIVTDELQIPDGEHVVTYLAKLKWADPQEVTQVLGTFVVQSPGQFTNITPLPKSSALLITENSVILRGILKVIAEMDIPPADVVAKFIPLERADAEDVQKKLLEIFQKTPTPGAPGSTPGGGAASRPPPRPTLPDGSPAPQLIAEPTGQSTIEISGSGLTEDAIIKGKITLTADKRTNRIHIVTRPENMVFVEKLIREFDQDVKFGEPSIRKLKFVSAADIFQVVVKAITDPGAQDTSIGGAAGGAARPATTQPRTDSQNRAGGGGSLGGGGGGSQTLSESLSATEKDVIPDAVTVGSAKLIADKRANAIIVLGNKEVKDKVFKVIDELDVRAPQVLLHTVIGQLTLSDVEQFGVNYFARKANEMGQNPGGAGTGTAAGNVLGGLAALSSIVNVGANGAPALNFNNLLLAKNFETAITAGSTGLSGIIGAGNTLDAIVTALATNNKFRVTARPSIFTSNNKKAIISSGEEIAIPSSIQSGFSGNTGNQNNGLVTNSQIQFKTVALQLEVLPLINSDREVTLDIVQKFDEQIGATRIDNNDIPRIATRVLQTTVSVPHEATLVLGGLIRQNNNKTSSGVPYLSKIPWLGALFRSTSDTKSREELVILIRPVVTFGPDEDVKARERAQEFLNLPPDLEPSIYPNPIKITTSAKKMLRRPSVPLRDSMVEVDPVPVKRK